jgi:DNA-binding HxlR family transcriptional regulator
VASLSQPAFAVSAIPQIIHQHADPASTRDTVLTLLVRHGEATASALAAHLEMSVQVVRRHLRGLEDDGLVESSPAAEGPGRPSNHWRLTAKGQGPMAATISPSACCNLWLATCHRKPCTDSSYNKPFSRLTPTANASAPARFLSGWSNW